MTLNIAIDARYIEKQGSGVSVYTENILKNLLKKKELSTFPIISDSQSCLSYLKDCESIFCPYSHQNHPLQDIWMTFKLPAILKKLKIDILFCPAFIIPLIKPPAKLGVMLHDLTFLFSPGTLNRRFAMYASFMTKRCVKLSDFILTPTQAIKDELAAYMKASPEKIHVVHHGRTLDVSGTVSGDEGSGDLKKFGIRKPYFLFVGNIEPRKNISFLVDVFQNLRKENSFAGHQLVLCGKKRWKSADVENEIKEKMGNIILTGFVDDHVLHSLYFGCEAVMAASLYEGFGFPVLEGMQAKKIVFSSDILPFREIGEDSLVYLAARDAVRSAQIISAAMKDESAKARIISKAEERARLFSWEKSSSEAIDVFKNILIRN
jgi:glycosyltransferase involved in cell wall biosynthesis